MQDGRTVLYVSLTLTPAEEQYCNIERELVGIVIVMARPPNYVYGDPVRVQTDRKTTGDHLEEANCHSKLKKKTTIKACKIRDQVRAH